MPVAADAVLQDDQGRALLRFERRLSHPPEKVWSALTESGEQFGWHPTPFEFEPTPGGRVNYLAGGDVPEMPDGEVTECEPPRLLAHTWGDDLLRWEVHPDEGGCLLVLTHTFDDRFKAARDATGWHLCLDALASLLQGEVAELFRSRSQEIAGEGPPRTKPQGWQELNRAYEERFGIPPEKATPPPEL